MKRLLLFIGILTLLALPVRAHAATEAISDAVNHVLERARQAVPAARDPNLIEDIVANSFPEWLRGALSTVLVRVTTRTSVVEQERSLAERSTCFRYDLWLIEREITRTWEELDAVELRGDVFAIIRLQEILSFLSNQYDELLAGGLHPERRNASWNIPLLSETSDEKEAPTLRLCFFHSSYTPPTGTGYGCGASELDRILTALPPEKTQFRMAVTRERAALALTEETTASIRRASEGLSRLQSSLDDLIEGKSSSSASSISSIPSISSPPSKQPIHGCLNDIDEILISRELRGPFTTQANEWRLLRDFWTLRRNESANRPLPEGLELSAKGDQFLDIDLNEARDALRAFSTEQSEDESATFAGAVDPGLALEDIFADLRQATTLLTRLGGSVEDGLPVFARNFAYWLRRSCIDRSACDERLDTILKFTFTPACFPYGNGDYKKSTCEQPQWKKCLYEATQPGEPIPNEEGCAEENGF